MSIKVVPTKPREGQKTGTSGLRKKTKEFMSDNYLANWVQSLFNALGGEVKGQALGLGGDGRYFGKEAAQVRSLSSCAVLRRRSRRRAAARTAIALRPPQTQHSTTTTTTH